MMNNQAIGILDSGLGGLTVWKEIIALLPQDTTIYLADSQNAPYGQRSEEEVYQLSKKLIEFLLQKQVKLIVVACNTITVSAIDKLRKEYPQIPIVGTVPVIKTAAERTKNGRIGILSTTRTAKSAYQKNLIKQFASSKRVFNYGTDTLVPLIEEGNLTGRQIDSALKKALQVFKREEIDTLALGCTHFPFLKEPIQQMLGSEVLILDSGAAIARQVKRILEHYQSLSMEQKTKYDFYTTGSPKVANQLLAGIIAGREFEKVKLSSRSNNID